MTNYGAQGIGTTYLKKQPLLHVIDQPELKATWCHINMTIIITTCKHAMFKSQSNTGGSW
jgi:hypothetical protein